MDRDYTIDDIREALRYLDESDRETWVRMGMAVKAEFGNAGMDAWMDWSAGYAKFKESDARQVWKSFRRGGISLGTLIHEARKQGWQPRQITDQAERARLAAEAAKRRPLLRLRPRLRQSMMPCWPKPQQSWLSACGSVPAQRGRVSTWVERKSPRTVPGSTMNR